MAQLHILERRQLEKLFQMGGGYVLDFSNRTLEEFVADSVGADIYDVRYHHGSGSKANRLRGYWKIESDALVGKLIRDLVEYAVYLNKDADPNLVGACRAVANRLLAASAARAPVTPAQALTQPPADTAVTTQPIRVFISYPWDSQDHKVGCGNTLRRNSLQTASTSFYRSIRSTNRRGSFSVHGDFSAGGRCRVVRMHSTLRFQGEWSRWWGRHRNQSDYATVF